MYSHAICKSRELVVVYSCFAQIGFLIVINIQHNFTVNFHDVVSSMFSTTRGRFPQCGVMFMSVVIVETKQQCHLRNSTTFLYNLLTVECETSIATLMCTIGFN